MKTITVICREEGYPDILIYSVSVNDPDDHDEVLAAINAERKRDLGDDVACKIEELYVAFAGDLTPCADWRS